MTCSELILQLLMASYNICVFFRIAFKTLMSINCGCLKTCLDVSLIGALFTISLHPYFGKLSSLRLECDPAFPIIVPDVMCKQHVYQFKPLFKQGFLNLNKDFIFLQTIIFLLPCFLNSTSVFFISWLYQEIIILCFSMIYLCS